MARKPRIHFPGAVYHVMLRGNAGQDIFTEDSDRSRFLLILQQEQELSRCRIHAYCLMDNHVHLALQVANVPLSKIMQKVGFRYTQYMNRNLKRTGHLFQGRFKAILVDENNYLLELVRYIHLNPLRVNLVADPDHYRWSSHMSYRHSVDTAWLTTDWVLSQFNSDRKLAKELYWRFIQDGFSDGFRKEFHSGTFEGRVLGDEQFIERALASAGQQYDRLITLNIILAAVCKSYNIEQKDITAPGKLQPGAEARGVAAMLVRRSGTLAISDLGTKLNRSMTALSHAASRIEQRFKSDKKLKERVDAAERFSSKYVSQA
jgi:REP element-mobilizing transposase RayT